MIILTNPNEVLGLIQQRVELEYTIDISSAIPEGEPDYNAKCILASMVWFPLNGDQSITLDEILNMKRGDKRIFFRKPVSVVQFECDSVWLGDILNSIRSSGVKVELIETVGQTVKRQWAYNQEVVKGDKNDPVKVTMDKPSKFNFIEKIDGMKIMDSCSTDGIKNAFCSLSQRDREKIECALSKKLHRPELRNLLRNNLLEVERAKNIVGAILECEEVDQSNEFAVLIREVLNCNGFRFDYFQNVFDKLYKPEQIAIVNALQHDVKQRLSDLSNGANTTEAFKSLVDEMMKFLK